MKISLLMETCKLENRVPDAGEKEHDRTLFGVSKIGFVGDYLATLKPDFVSDSKSESATDRSLGTRYLNDSFSGSFVSSVFVVSGGGVSFFPKGFQPFSFSTTLSTSSLAFSPPNSPAF